MPGGFVFKSGSVGFLGEKSVMDTPFTQTTLTNKTIELFGGSSQPLDSILSNSPSIQASGSVLHNDFTLRGFRANGTSTYVNGIPGMFTQFNAPTFFIDHVDIISGPNSGISGTGAQYESDSAGGLINFVSKKAPEEPMTRYTQTFSGIGSFGGYMDIARRFGKDKAWGVRINTELLNGETSIHGENMKAKGIFVNVDHRDDKSTTNVLTGYRQLEIEGGMRWFKLGSGVTQLPSAPKSSSDYSFDGMVKASRGWILAVNHEQKVSDNWSIFFNGGLNRNNLTKNVSPYSSSFTIDNDAGDYDLLVTNGGTPMNTYYAQVGTQGKITDGEVTHNLTFAVDQSWRNRKSATSNEKNSIGQGNIYHGIVQNSMPNTNYTTGLAEKQKLWGWSVVDTIEYEKWQLLVGVHKHFASVDSYTPATGKKSGSVDSDAFCPTYAITYKPEDKLSLYASHSESFNKGTVVSSAYNNAGDILDPAKTKQNEIGMKYENAGILTTLSFFDITQANNIDVLAAGSTTQYDQIQDGRDRHKGVEVSANGRLADKWNVMGGFMILDATREKTKNGQYDGYDVSGRAKWNSVVGLEYQADEKFSVTGRARYTGSSTINNETITVPGYTTFDLGVKYRTKIKSTPATFNLMCYNLTNKDYWMASRGDQIYVSMPRTIMLSAQFDI
ncbi:TonB-dependent receptor [Pelosinus fermentans]|uniref:TonB-dependent receptor n=1 Tax=Pelosinus fermentans TaxID=365349 RepID=UPI00130DDFD4|nr:TonB-dependent siderophore receptor [Pelosinus fermentans]